MFDGVPAEQFHQFIASSRASVVPLVPLSSFPLHGSSTHNNFTSFDPFPSHHHHHHHQPIQLEPHLLSLLHHPSPTHKEEEKEANISLISTSLELERERSMPEQTDPWSNDEVLALLRIRSNMETWFPDFTWEHVSRKLAELGFKRSGEKCKEKFEEESRHFNSMSTTFSKNYRILSELEELCHGENQNNPQIPTGKNQDVEKLPNEKEESRDEEIGKSNSSQENGKKSKDRKRKRHRRLEMLMGFCEEVVSKMMAQQEELNNKLIEDMVKRDEEKIAREETWKKQEMDRIDKEIEFRAQQQAIAGDRQTKLIEFLKKFTSNSSENQQSFGIMRNENFVEVSNCSFSSTSPTLIQPQNPNPIYQPCNQNKHETTTLSTMVNTTSQNPSFLTTIKNPNENPSSGSSLVANGQRVLVEPTSQNPNLAQNEREDIGKRWPKDEVLALINLRCSLNNSSGTDGGGPHEEKEGSKGPLWERISQKMLELGYKRSAKRCKEKWENINKYFRKTKDVNKKRSLDSRTCPYFHQLSCLYSQGTLVASPVDGPENHSARPPQNHIGPPVQGDESSDANMHVGEDAKDMIIQEPALDF